LRIAFVYPNAEISVINRFISGFKEGMGIYPGFRTWFRVDVKDVDRYTIKDFNVSSYEEAIDKVVREDYDLVFILLDTARNVDSLYSLIKTKLLANGIPCQAMRVEKLYLPSDQFQWILANIALATYAKVGGTPWVIQARERPGIVLGMSRAMDKERRIIVGFTTIFKHNGDFILSYSKSPVTTWDRSIAAIQKLLQVEEMSRENLLKSLAIWERPGKRLFKRLIQMHESSGKGLFIDRLCVPRCCPDRPLRKPEHYRHWSLREAQCKVRSILCS